MRGCSSTGLPPRAEAVMAQASLSHKATEKRRVGSELVTSVSEDLSLQLGCSCIFPFALPTPIYLVYPIYPFCSVALWTYLMLRVLSSYSSNCRSNWTINLTAGHNVLVKISKKSDRDGTVPMLGAGTTRQAVCQPLLATWGFFSQCGLGSRIYEDTLNLGCNSV